MRVSTGFIASVSAAALLVIAACAGGSTNDPPPGTGPIPTGPYVAGRSYFSRSDYVEYIAGNAPVIFTAPHGGTLTPAGIPTRSCGTNTTDLNTQDLVRRMQAAFFARTGRYPHIVINRLARSKLDANRELAEATCGDTTAARSWDAWHAFLEVAKRAVLTSEGKGWYMDMHGHGHPIQRLELGYLLTDSDLGLTDAALDAGGHEATSSIATVSRDDTARAFAAVLRGPTSLGTMYADEGFPSLPSASDRMPNGALYFNGGYNTERYGCRDGGALCGVQIEANLTGVRDDSTNRKRFAEATVRVLERYLALHWSLVLKR